jgi:hypothetical protein
MKVNYFSLEKKEFLSREMMKKVFSIIYDKLEHIFNFNKTYEEENIEVAFNQLKELLMIGGNNIFNFLRYKSISIYQKLFFSFETSF